MWSQKTEKEVRPSKENSRAGEEVSLLSSCLTPSGAHPEVPKDCQELPQVLSACILLSIRSTPPHPESGEEEIRKQR